MYTETFDTGTFMLNHKLLDKPQIWSLGVLMFITNLSIHKNYDLWPN